MTNEEYIRKAVELADGWECDGSRYYHSNFRGQWRNMGQVQRDALATQLVRQVVALRHYVSVYNANTQVWVANDRVANEYGSDITMNTIKAIVDSRVLEQSDE